MKQLKDVAVYGNAFDMDSVLFRMILPGSSLCRVETANDVREVVRWLAPCERYDRCYIKAVYSDGSSELIPPTAPRSDRQRFVFVWDDEDFLPAA